MPVPTALDNPNPVIFSSKKDLKRERKSIWAESIDDSLDPSTNVAPDDSTAEEIDSEEIYGMCKA
jgi:hypothetical protein